MEHKLLIVTTNEGGIPSIVNNGKNGFLVEKNDANNLAIAIENLLNNPILCEKMGEEGYKIYKKKFTQKHFETRMNEVIKMVFSQ